MILAEVALAREEAEPVETALRAPDAGEALAPISAETEGGGGAHDEREAEPAKGGGVALLISSLELGEAAADGRVRILRQLRHHRPSSAPGRGAAAAHASSSFARSKPEVPELPKGTGGQGNSATSLGAVEPAMGASWRPLHPKLNYMPCRLPGIQETNKVQGRELFLPSTAGLLDKEGTLVRRVELSGSTLALSAATRSARYTFRSDW